MKYDTASLKMHLDHVEQFQDEDVAVIQAYHTSRLADAMERIADHIENNQISMLEGSDIVNQLAIIAKKPAR